MRGMTTLTIAILPVSAIRSFLTIPVPKHAVSTARTSATTASVLTIFFIANSPFRKRSYPNSFYHPSSSVCVHSTKRDPIFFNLLLRKGLYFLEPGFSHRPQALASGQEINRVQNRGPGNFLLRSEVELLDTLHNLGHQLRRGQIVRLHRTCGDLARRLDGDAQDNLAAHGRGLAQFCIVHP